MTVILIMVKYFNILVASLLFPNLQKILKGGCPIINYENILSGLMLIQHLFFPTNDCIITS